MKQVAQIILENPRGELLIYKRDNNPDIPYPGHWDLIGGHLEEGETPEQALVREVMEEIGIELAEYTFFKKYDVFVGDVWQNIKYIYTAKIDIPLQDLTLYEGEKLMYVSRAEICNINFANILKDIVLDYIKSNV
ncbi:MAG: NUDIX domain-containing protein [Nitrospira sp.]|nr:NUDIX domain-containing protein [bacterium]MBL7050152.1 NUDIX domain-containing protein [Nitrospira sp.]